MGERWENMTPAPIIRGGNEDWSKAKIRVALGGALGLIGLACWLVISAAGFEIQLPKFPPPPDPPAMYVISDTYQFPYPKTYEMPVGESGSRVQFARGTFVMKPGETVQVTMLPECTGYKWLERKVTVEDETILQPIGVETFKALRLGRVAVSIGCVEPSRCPQCENRSYGQYFFVVVH